LNYIQINHCYILYISYGPQVQLFNRRAHSGGHRRRRAVDAGGVLRPADERALHGMLRRVGLGAVPAPHNIRSICTCDICLHVDFACKSLRVCCMYVVRSRYSTTYQNEDHTLTFGISKNVYILPVASEGAVITDVVPEIFYNAPHPIARLADGEHAGFTVRTRVYLWSPSGLNAKLRVSGSWGSAASAQITEVAGAAVAIVNMSASAEQVRLWWPNGKGSRSVQHSRVSYTLQCVPVWIGTPYIISY